MAEVGVMYTEGEKGPWARGGRQPLEAGKGNGFSP